MSEENSNVPGKRARITGWVLSIVAILFLLLSGVMKFIQPGGDEFTKGLDHIGWTPDATFKLGFLEIACVLVYLFPRTAVLGAILMTAYMGGAIATHVRVGDMFVIQVLIGVVIWAGLYLRDARIRQLLPLN